MTDRILAKNNLHKNSQLYLLQIMMMQSWFQIHQSLNKQTFAM